MGQKWSRSVTGTSPEKKPSWGDINHYYSELLEIDEQYCQLLKDGLRAFLDLRLTELGKPEDARKAVLDSGLVCLTGSCSDGGGTCRWFRNSLADVEIDIMSEVGCVKLQDEAAVVMMIPDKPGFARVYNGIKTFQCLHPLLIRDRPELCQQFNTGRAGQEFVDTANMQEEVGKVFPHRDEDGEIPRIAAALMEVDVSDLGILLTEKVEGPSAMTELIVCLREDQKVLYSSDNVLSLKLLNWPEVLNQWLRRESRTWQNEKQHIIDACFQQGCHMVAKKSPTDGLGNTEWRLSFSYMEKILMTSWNKHQKLSYFLLKSLFYRYIRPIEFEGKHIPSYAVKTEMFWVIEQTKTSEWTEENLKMNTLKVLQKFHEDLRARIISNYFLPSMNVVDHNTYQKQLTDKVANIVKGMIDNLDDVLPQDLEKMARLGRAILTVMNAILAYLRFTIIKAGNETARRQASGLEDALQAINFGVDVVALFQGFIGNKKK